MELKLGVRTPSIEIPHRCGLKHQDGGLRWSRSEGAL